MNIDHEIDDLNRSLSQRNRGIRYPLKRLAFNKKPPNKTAIQSKTFKSIMRAINNETDRSH